MTLTAAQLVSPLPSGVVAGVTPTTVASNTWLANLLANAGTLPVTSWQVGGVAWTEMLAMATVLAISDANISIVAQGSLLDFASVGTVTYTNAQGTTVTVPVTPDPSIPTQNATGALGWLDALATASFNTTRVLASYAGGSLYFANTTAASFGTYLPGTFHVANTFTGAGYTNTSTFTFGPSSVAGTSISAVVGGNITTSTAHGLSNGQVVYLSNCPGLSFATVLVTGVTTFTMVGQSGTMGTAPPTPKVYIASTSAFVADLIGPNSNSGPLQAIVPVTTVPGGYVGNVTAWAGSQYESNISLAARCRAHNQSVSVNGPKGAYIYYALAATQILAAQTPSVALTSPITRAAVSLSTGTGTVSVTVANASGGVLGAGGTAIIGATNASPIVLTVPTTGFMATGMISRVQGVNGNLGANGVFPIIVLNGTTLSLSGSTGTGGYLSGGTIYVGDVGLVDGVIQAYATPNAVTALTSSASPLVLNITATVYVPLANLNDYGTNPATNKGAVALSSFIPQLPIGGITGLGPVSGGIIPASEIIQLLFDAGQTAGRVYTVSVSSLLVNGLSGDIPMTSLQVATVGTLAIQAIGV